MWPGGNGSEQWPVAAPVSGARNHYASRRQLRRGRIRLTRSGIEKQIGLGIPSLNRYAEIRRRKESRKRKPTAKAPKPFVLCERHGANPFTVLNAAHPHWQAQKKRWHRLGIDSTLGRDSNLGRFSDAARKGWNGTSKFDPVLCELAYRWWCPPGGTVIDPFAGGSVRGLVALLKGHTYFGADLSARQIEANFAQRDRVAPGADIRWVCGDSRDPASIPRDITGDLLFTCPPYFDLEVYSNDARDLSAMKSWDQFVEAYVEIINLWSSQLRDDRFAVVVIGERRGPGGLCRGLLRTTLNLFDDAGLGLYQTAVLATPPGPALRRASKNFKGGRKLTPVHQNVLVFVKGDVKRAERACMGRGNLLA